MTRRDRLDEYNARRMLAAKRNKETPVKKRRPPGDLRERIHAMPCAVCNRRGVEFHHIVPRSAFGRRDTDVHHENNAMPLCHTCHQHHHTTADRRVPRHLLTPAQIKFVLDRQGPGWLDNWYPAHD